MYPNQQQILDVQLEQCEEESFLTDMEDEQNLIKMVTTPSQAMNRDEIGKFSQYLSNYDTIRTNHDDFGYNTREYNTREDGASNIQDIS